jgi:hypothetical protein
MEQLHDSVQYSLCGMRFSQQGHLIRRINLLSYFKDDGNILLQNVGNYLPGYMAAPSQYTVISTCLNHMANQHVTYHQPVAELLFYVGLTESTLS